MSTKITQTVKKFRGINQYMVKTALTPEYAEDCRNVFVSGTGGLEKFRIPQPFTAPIANVGAVQVRSFFNYQQGTGIRQILGHLGTNIIRWDQNLVPAIVDNSASNQSAVPFDFVEANNLLFMANNVRMIKWNGAVIQNWGIAKPAAPPTIIILGGNITPAGANRAANVETFTTSAAHGLAIGDLVTIAGVTDVTFNGARTVATIVDALNFACNNVAANSASGNGTVVITGGYAIGTGKTWRYSYGNSVTGHESSASNPSASTGIVAPLTGYRVIPVQSPDAQVDTIFIYGTLDGGGDYFLEKTIAINVNYTSVAANPVDPSQRAQLVNDPPPVGKYLSKFADRIFIFNLLGATHFIAYTGYEAILRGRPEESCPPQNRLRLDVGADEIRGGGVIQGGVVAFSKSNEMFMFRGEVEDIVLTAPVVFTAFLEQLPWQEGLLSHYTCASTPYGLAYLAADKNVKIFDGTKEPLILSTGVLPMLRNITPGAEELCRGCFFNYADRDWYALLVPLYGAQQPNFIFFFDLISQDNLGCFVVQQPADSIGVVEDTASGRHLCIGYQGQLLELKVISDTISGITPPEAVTQTVGILPAFWRGGYYGNDTPQMTKMYRYGRLITDQTGFSVDVNLVDDNKYKFRAPLQRHIELQADGKFPINWKSKRCQVQINFPVQDISANVLESQMSFIPLGDR